VVLCCTLLTYDNYKRGDIHPLSPPKPLTFTFTYNQQRRQLITFFSLSPLIKANFPLTKQFFEKPSAIKSLIPSSITSSSKSEKKKNRTMKKCLPCKEKLSWSS
jgi:hypothetical protein